MRLTRGRSETLPGRPDAVAYGRLPLVVLAASFAGHAWSFLYVLLWPQRIPIQYPSEYLVLLIVSATLELGGFAVATIIPYRSLQAGRVIVLSLALFFLEGRSVGIAVILTLPLLAETVLYDSDGASLLLNAASVPCLMAGLIRPLLPSDPVAAASSAIHYGFAVVFGGGALWLAIHHRENLVRTAQELANMRDTVARLAEANKAIQTYAGSLESEATVKERTRIAQDLHDTIGHALTSVVVMMNAGRALLKENPEELDEMLRRTCVQSEEALNQTRQILYRLRNMPSPEPRGLQAIFGLLQLFRGATSMKVTLHSGNLPLSLGPRLDSVLYRLVQEGLTNAFRHGGATAVTVYFWITEKEILAKVHDNGHGIPGDSQVVEGMGIKGMRERLAAVGGSLTPRGVSDGFVLEATIPYQQGPIDE